MIILHLLGALVLGTPIVLPDHPALPRGSVIMREGPISADEGQNTTTVENGAQDPSEPAPDPVFTTVTIVGLVIGIFLILGAVVLLIWCGRRDRFPGAKRKERGDKGAHRPSP
ncbi:hypothetical protein SAMD00023353_7700350 [Rosellinia necatrix]|uniref:Uncharacterized protein n=1 Tax=Rosellinia necatrix TaxID=77044 RepID=A0A1S8AAQ7_ROSNE|nr:hypothetical protein SAMD00023353_7700350 [Rosellinia necatrix]